MVVVSSAFMSSRHARTTRSVSSASGRRETGSGERRLVTLAAREIAGADRVLCPFVLVAHAPADARDSAKIIISRVSCYSLNETFSQLWLRPRSSVLYPAAPVT